MSSRDRDVAIMRSFVRRTREAERHVLAARLAQAQADADRIVAYLIAQLDPPRIYRWGSLLRPETFQAISDIDIALEGVADTADFGRAVEECRRMTTLPLDILRIEDVHPLYRAEIIDRGEVVYER